MYYIYELICPIENVVKYIGLSKNPQKRYYSHLTEGNWHFSNLMSFNGFRKLNNRKVEWISNLKKQGLKPLLNIIFEFEIKSDAIKKERELILHNRSLLNSNKINYGRK